MDTEQDKKPKAVKKVKIVDIEEMPKVESVKIVRKARFQKGSQEARDYMQTLRDKRGLKKEP